MIPVLLRNRFKILLATLVAVILISPAILDGIVDAAPGMAQYVVFAFAVSLLLAGTVVVRGERRLPGVFVVLLFTSLALDTLAAFLWPEKIALWTHGSRSLFLGFLVVELMRRLFQPKVIDFDTICASLCVYLLIGIIWMNLFMILETLAPGSVDFANESDRHNPVDPLQRMLHMLYFSFTTLTTVGYGDLIPCTNAARMLAITEALVGQCYLLVMVSRLVGLHIAQEFPASPSTTQIAHDIKDGKP